MKSIFKYILPLSVMTFAASCGSDAVLDEMTDDELVEVNFTSSSAVQSRFDDYGFDNGDRVYIYMIQPDGNFGERKEFRYSNGSLLPVTDTFKKRKNETVEFLAFTPGFTSSANSLIFYGGSTDFLAATAETSSATAELEFVHLHSQIRVRVLNNEYSITSMQLLNIDNQEVLYYDEEESAIFMTCDGRTSAASLIKDGNSSTYPYYYYLPNDNYMPDMQLKITDMSGSSTTFTFASKFGYAKGGHVYYLDADLSPRNNIKAGRGGDDVLELECVKIEKM